MTAPHPSCRDCRFPLRTIALIGKYQSREIAESLSLLAKNLHDRGVDVLVEEATASLSDAGIDPRIWTRCGYAEIGMRADAAIVVGGDGTMLNAARHLARHHVPLVGINQGRLGFMTDIALDQVDSILPSMLRGAYSEDVRHLLHAQVLQGDSIVFESLALNDVTINRESTSGMIELRVEVDGHFVCNQRADGLIVATSTGSTAYALSAGGPLMHPSIAGWVLVPIAPHTLSNRPIVISQNSCIRIEVVSPRDATANFDAQTHYAPLQPGQCVQIRRSGQSVRFLHPLNWNYFDTLREKLHWNKGSA